MAYHSSPLLKHDENADFLHYMLIVWNYCTLSPAGLCSVLFNYFKTNKTTDYMSGEELDHLIDQCLGHKKEKKVFNTLLFLLYCISLKYWKQDSNFRFSSMYNYCMMKAHAAIRHTLLPSSDNTNQVVAMISEEEFVTIAHNSPQLMFCPFEVQRVLMYVLLYINNNLIVDIEFMTHVIICNCMCVLYAKF